MSKGVLSSDGPQHAALLWCEKFKAACEDRDPAVGELSWLAEILPRAARASDDSRACVIGALLQVFEMAQRDLRTSHAKDRAAELSALQERLKLQLSAKVDEAFKGLAR